ncbi:NnrS family protein [Marinobacter sp. AL4B]|uniref:NnrS family protein n=1 Tax=Marinobacter sp. AL4B TaxID=2871173 RepID=UPI001CAA4F31|nr:NnrS family protein [Marinobacter sp. AL4B]MBZ0334743.1 NnrS family protein [Marinobacter sp. AL4B]
MPGKPFHAFWLFFPAASLWAALSVPLSIFSATSGWPVGLIGAGHGHELLFGFALALVAGYTLGPQPWRVLIPIFLVWLLARASWLIAPELLISRALSIAFALMVARQVVPRFQAAKKWRNKVAGPLILALCLATLAYSLSQYGLPLPSVRRIMLATIIGLLLLMTFIGGRAIAPAIAGILEKRGISLNARVQPRIEGALLILLSLAMLLILTPIADPITGLLLIISGGLIGLRATRWKLWLFGHRPDLLVFGLGYLWLAAGSTIIGIALLSGRAPLPAMHLITIGALGTLSCSVMLRQAWQRAQRRFPPRWQVLAVAVTTSVAAISRFSAGSNPHSQPDLLWISATAWSVTYVGVFIQLLLLFWHSQSKRIQR